MSQSAGGPGPAKVVLTAFATWTTGGVSVGGAPAKEPSPTARLGPWDAALGLSKIHPRARRPHPAAKAMVQLAHAVLEARRALGQPPDPGSVGLCLGSLAGCVAADYDFQQGLLTRGLAFGSPATFVYTLPTATPAEVSIALGLKGGLVTLSAGSASGLAAVAAAAAQIAGRRAAACLCGGFEMPGTAGAAGSESMALFLLERAGALDAACSLEASAGFGEPPMPAVLGDPLLALALAASGAGPATARITAASPQGPWASVTLHRPAGESQ